MSRLSSRQGWLLTAVAAVGLSVGLSLALRQGEVSGQDRAVSVSGHSADVSTPTKTPEELKHDPVVEHANSLSRAFRESAQVAMPSVVTVYSHESAKKVKGVRGANGMNGSPFGGANPFEGTPWADQFKGLIPQTPGGEDFRTPSRDGMGTGVIIDKSGIILTNNHVVEGADTVTVHFSDGREFKATEVKTDPQSDLAVVRIKADTDLPVAHLGNSDELEIGDWVLAIGNPFEQEKTVTAGIISGKGRTLGSSHRTEFLQTDAAINPGNSGGPLVNLTGEVVGINTAIASNSGGYQGLGFAIPINQAKWVTEQLIKDGSVHRGYLGVKIGEVRGELASQLGVASGEGAFVNDVFPNTPAAEAKLQAGDVITRFDGHQIHGPQEVTEWVERSTVGKSEPVDIIRDGKKLTLNVVVKAMPENYGLQKEEEESAVRPTPDTSGYSADDLGLQVTDLNPEEAKTYKGFSGVIIKKVDPDSIAGEKGLRPGMLIHKIGNTEIRNVKDFETAMKNVSLTKGLLMQIRTQEGNHFVVLKAQ
jgi:serine protease Do